MSKQNSEAIWNFDSAISLLRSLEKSDDRTHSIAPPTKCDERTLSRVDDKPIQCLGDFSSIWKYLGLPDVTEDENQSYEREKRNPGNEVDLDLQYVGKGVRWRDEYDGADLEDNVEPAEISASNLRTRKRAARRAKQRERESKLANLVDIGHNKAVVSDTATDVESGEELEKLRRSPDRRAIISEMLGRPQPSKDISPPTSPSPPKLSQRTPVKSDWPVSNPFIWSVPGLPSPGRRATITPQDGLTPASRKRQLISALAAAYPEDKKYLINSGLTEPAFTPLNVSSLGVHVFVDMSNISIGFHDCLKVIRGIPITTRVPRIPMNFHNFSLILERGRPAAKRTLVGSDRTQATVQAERIGYETNILDRVHKAKQLTPRQKKYHHQNHLLPGGGTTGHGTGGSASGMGETSGSETNAGYSSSNPLTGYYRHAGNGPAKFHEQGVDEILHLKMMESLVDAERPGGTIVLATGDAAEAEYSAGFLKMVERALRHGWMVELVSFKLNTSSLYKRKEFRDQWGPMFKWVQLDNFAEMLIDEDE